MTGVTWPGATPAVAAEGGDDRGPAWTADYGDDGLVLTSPGGGWIFEPAFRLQFRYSEPFDDPPRTTDGLQSADESELELNRSRFKMDTQLGLEALTLYVETDVEDPRLLDLRATWEPGETLGVRVGQWKTEYSRERRDSSGSLTMVDRSIVNREFTIDRQQGAMLYGRLKGGGAADLNWWAGVFGGAGRGQFNDGGEPLYTARLQWNPFGRVLGFSQSDIGRRGEPAASVAVAGAHNRSRYTRFSSDGGGQLDGFEPGETDQYELEQFVFETALQWRGFSWQQEWHRKRVDDRLAGQTQTLEGFYAQTSVFPSEAWQWWPRPLEIGVRFATVDPDTDSSQDRRDELTIGANWFFDGHPNKLTLDLSRLDVNDATGEASEWRLRAQWDVTF